MGEGGSDSAGSCSGIDAELKPQTHRFGRALRAPRYLERRGGPARGAVFLDDNGRPASPTALYKGIRGLGARAGISDVRSHSTRSGTFATRYLLLGGDLLTLARLLGHSPHS